MSTLFLLAVYSLLLFLLGVLVLWERRRMRLGSVLRPNLSGMTGSVPLRPANARR